MTPTRVAHWVLAATLLALATTSATAKGRVSVPLPPPRPADLGASPASPDPPSSASPPGDPCLARLVALGVAFQLLPPQGAGACRVEAPVSVTGLRGVLLSPAAIVVCPLAEALARWSSEIVAPAALTHLGGPVKRLEIGGSYECRGRNRQAFAPLSEHAVANAADVMAFATARTIVRVANAPPGTPEGRFVSEVRAAACGRFGTVLGPGSDPYHSDHLHLDGKVRRQAYCR